MRACVRVALVGAILSAICAPQLHHVRAQSAEYYNKNGWIGRVLIPSNGQFLGCLASTKFTQTIAFGVVQLSDGTWIAALAKPGGFQRLMNWDIELRVDGTLVHRGTAKVGTDGLALLTPALSTSAVSALTIGHKLQVTTIRGNFEYALAGSADAIEATAKCVRYFSSTSRNASGPLTERSEAPRASSGTGFFIKPDGIVLTNAHVVEGCSSVSAGFPGSAVVMARVIAKDSANDLALLATSLRPTIVPNLRLDVRTGEPIAIYGFPFAGALPSTGNFTLGNVTATAGLRDNTRELQISAPVQPGSSGGPVLDQSGNVVGIVYAKMNALAVARIAGDIPQNVNFAVKSGTVATFLQTHGVKAALGGLSERLEPADLAEQAKSFTVYLKCQR